MRAILFEKVCYQEGDILAPPCLKELKIVRTKFEIAKYEIVEVWYKLWIVGQIQMTINFWKDKLCDPYNSNEWSWNLFT